jgi:hypothetical protein
VIWLDTQQTNFNRIPSTNGLFCAEVQSNHTKPNFLITQRITIVWKRLSVAAHVAQSLACVWRCSHCYGLHTVDLFVSYQCYVLYAWTSTWVHQHVQWNEKYIVFWQQWVSNPPIVRTKLNRFPSSMHWSLAASTQRTCISIHLHKAHDWMDQKLHCILYAQCSILCTWNFDSHACCNLFQPRSDKCYIAWCWVDNSFILYNICIVKNLWVFNSA